MLKNDVMSREIEGQILILTPREEFLYTLNASGQVLWEMLAKGTTAQKLVDALVRRYGISPTQAQGDVQTFVRGLRAKGILAGK